MSMQHCQSLNQMQVTQWFPVQMPHTNTSKNSTLTIKPACKSRLYNRLARIFSVSLTFQFHTRSGQIKVFHLGKYALFFFTSCINVYFRVVSQTQVTSVKSRPEYHYRASSPPRPPSGLYTVINTPLTCTDIYTSLSWTSFNTLHCCPVLIPRPLAVWEDTFSTQEIRQHRSWQQS